MNDVNMIFLFWLVCLTIGWFYLFCKLDFVEFSNILNKRDKND